MPPTVVPSHDQVAQATDTLAQVKEYLRTEPPVADMLPLLAPLLDEDTGVAILLGDILRAAARIVATQSPYPYSDVVRHFIDDLRYAAWDATDLHTLHWNVHHLSTQIADTTDAPDLR
ncbi:hypothetical protein [Streptomyces noursei]|uniref:hypothetical protein n=1 Tax=Streptomyces noursei TaxID=1971 RepID=UPI00045EE558|nr:hypothetical protein [Streptomyces noursei]AIA06645.1 hypothetical protein DC74_6204 [Streptomyces noursei]